VELKRAIDVAYSHKAGGGRKKIARVWNPSCYFPVNKITPFAVNCFFSLSPMVE